MEKIPNKEAFNILVGIIFSDMIECFPGPSDLMYHHFKEKMSFEPAVYKKELFFKQTIEWLDLFNYIQTPRTNYSVIAPYIITPQTLAILNAMPANLGGETFGNKISKAAKDVANDAGKKALGETMGEFFGSTLGGLIKSSGI